MTRLISVLGTPSPLFYATVNVVRALTDATLGQHLVVYANSLDVLRANFPSTSARGDKPVVILSDYPQPDLLSTLLAAEARMTVCADDFTAIAHLSVVSREYFGVNAARFASMALVNIEPIITAPPRYSAVVNDPRKKLTELISDLADLYNLPLDNGDMEKILAALRSANRSDITLGDYAAKVVEVRENAREKLERRSPLDNGLIDFLALQYSGIARGHRLEKLEWPVYALLRPEFPDRLTIGPIDLTGPARFIHYGPYFALPAGAWSVDVSIETSDCFGQDLFEIDVTAGKILSIVQAKLPQHGVYGCQVRFQIDDPLQPVELRLKMLTGAIEGVIQMHGIALSRLASLDERDYDEPSG
jgi:hypothetical protein